MPRTFRRTGRAAVLLAVTGLVTAATLAVSGPASAQAVCTVNGVPTLPDANGEITGSLANDVIICPGVIDVAVNGIAGDDDIEIGTIAAGGFVSGDADNDNITVGAINLGGFVIGGPQEDVIIVGENSGAVIGGDGGDAITVELNAVVPLVGRGLVAGAGGDDVINVIANFADVNGGPGTDICNVTSLPGFGPTVTNCEA